MNRQENGAGVAPQNNYLSPQNNHLQGCVTKIKKGLGVGPSQQEAKKVEEYARAESEKKIMPQDSWINDKFDVK